MKERKLECWIGEYDVWNCLFGIIWTWQWAWFGNFHCVQLENPCQGWYFRIAHYFEILFIWTKSGAIACPLEYQYLKWSLYKTPKSIYQTMGWLDITIFEQWHIAYTPMNYGQPHVKFDLFKPLPSRDYLISYHFSTVTIFLKKGGANPIFYKLRPGYRVQFTLV